MQVEAIGKPIRYRLKSGEEVILQPGMPIDLPEQSARELLIKAAGKVRLVEQCRDLTIETGGGHSSSVYWESTGRILGPGLVLQVVKGDKFWLAVEYGEAWCWINADLLRSRKAFEQQNREVCNCCGGIDFWRSQQVIAICRRCHPPMVSAVMKEVKS